MSLRNTLSLLAVLIALGLTPAANAMTVQTLDLTEGNVNATWEGKGGIQMSKTPSGILLKTTATGMFITDTDLTISPEAAAIVATTDVNVPIYFVWVFKDDPDQHLYDVSVELQKGNVLANNFSLSDVPHWSSAKKKLGIVLPPNSLVLLHGIEFRQWNMFERVWAGVTSFWKFDDYRPYSINFVWGPQIATNPVETHEIYSILPPPSLSGMYAAYWTVIVLLILCGLFCILKRSSKRRYALAAGIIVLVVWAVMDLRMGSEYLSYVAHDQKSYIGGTEGLRNFRDRDRFYDFAAFADPYVFDRQSYVFFAQQQWPYLGNMRYLTYPSIPGIDIDHDDTWVVYDRPDVSLGADGRLLVSGEPYTEAGKILARFDATSFVFRTNTPPAPAK